MITVSDWALNIECMYCQIPNSATPANSAAAIAGKRLLPSSVPVSRYAIRPAKIDPPSEIATAVVIHSHSAKCPNTE